MKIVVNDKDIETQETSLKKVLEKHGMHFPCQGKGICGRCKVVCHSLSPTNLDNLFLTPTQINEGVRLACDKKVKENIKICFETVKNQNAIQKLDFANVAIIIDEHKMSIFLLDYDIVTERVVENRMVESQNKKMYVRSLIAKECIELFEDYGIAHAQTIAIATNSHVAAILIGAEGDGFGDLIEASELMLPAQDVYLLPFVNNQIGGDFICFASLQSPECIVIKADTEFVAALIKEDEVLCLAHSNLNYEEKELAALNTSIQLLLKQTERPPIFKLTGLNASAIISLLQDYSYIIEDPEIIAEAIAMSIDNNRLKSQFYKLRKRISVLPTVESQEWQELFNLSSNY